jgi:hypothetical protein
MSYDSGGMIILVLVGLYSQRFNQGIQAAKKVLQHHRKSMQMQGALQKPLNEKRSLTSESPVISDSQLPPEGIHFLSDAMFDYADLCLIAILGNPHDYELQPREICCSLWFTNLVSLTWRSCTASVLMQVRRTSNFFDLRCSLSASNR